MYPSSRDISARRRPVAKAALQPAALLLTPLLLLLGGCDRTESVSVADSLLSRDLTLAPASAPVSYTHLTLPTSDLV